MENYRFPSASKEELWKKKRQNEGGLNAHALGEEKGIQKAVHAKQK